jgi:predicted dehydrogenase
MAAESGLVKEIILSVLSRRDLVRAGVATMTASSYSRVLGANERIRIAVIGCGSRGTGQVRTFQNFEQCEVVGLCDVYGRKVESAKRFAAGAAAFSDHRKALEMPNLDAVMIATPDHWHVPISLDAVAAGKDVYCEKPLTLNISEGAGLIKAVADTKRVFQTGMQQRSGPHYMQARDEYLRKGKLGKVTMVRTYWYGSVSSFAKPVPPELKTQPQDLDWKRFVGPVKWRPYHPYQYNVFRAYLDYGGGQFTDLFAHWVDVAHMLLDEDRPSGASAMGGFYMPELQNDGSGRTAPDTVAAQVEYPGGWTCTFEATLAAGMNANGVELYGTKGRMLITRSGFEFTPVDTNTAAEGIVPRPNRQAAAGAPAQYVYRQPPFPPPPLTNKDTVIVKAEGNLGDHHTRNFLECIKSREKPNGNVVLGHRAAAACHLCTMSYKEKRQIRYDPGREEVVS